MEKNIYALVTGASSGMGFEYSRQLAARGYNVIMCALFQNETDAAAESVRKEFPDRDIVPIGMDLSQADAAEQLYAKVRELLPEAIVEVLINNAGVLFPMHFHNMSEAQVGKIIMIHNYTLSMLIHYFLPQMRERKKGYILNISSLAAWLPYPFISMYAATKAFTRTLTRALRTELRGSGVNVCTIYFGAVSTNLYNLDNKLRKLARNLGIMLTPQKACSIALKMMFRGRSGRTPGFINRFFRCLVPLIPHCFISSLDKMVTRKWNFK